MNYHIECNGMIIASFVHESDRDYCLDFLAEKYNDCEFIGVELDHHLEAVQCD